MKQCHAGIDVSAKTLAVSTDLPGRATGTFDNTAEGHKKLVSWLTARGRACRVVLEPSGIYSLDLALALDAAPRVEVMVANPRRVANFARATSKRGKTDAMDADVLLQFTTAMPFVPWTRPSQAVLELRQVTRYAAAMVRQRTRALNKRHAALSTSTTPAVILEDLDYEIEELERRIKAVRDAATQMVEADPVLRARYELLKSIPGVGNISAVVLIAELAVLPDDMSVRQWVAHAGLDPRPKQSGTSVRGQTRISKHGNAYLRLALFMPAMTAVQRDENVKAFATKLVANGKRRLQAIVAIMRKLLHAIFGMLKNETPWNGDHFYRIPSPTT